MAMVVAFMVMSTALSTASYGQGSAAGAIANLKHGIDTTIKNKTTTQRISNLNDAILRKAELDTFLAHFDTSGGTLTSITGIQGIITTPDPIIGTGTVGISDTVLTLQAVTDRGNVTSDNINVTDGTNTSTIRKGEIDLASSTYTARFQPGILELSKTSTSGYTVLDVSGSTPAIGTSNPNGTFQGTLQTPSLTASRIYRGPDSSGTIALLSNIAGFITTTSTNTLTNKRITLRVGSTTSSATPTINTDNFDIYKLTALTTNVTSFTTNLSGTPVDGDIFELEITGTAARTLAWGASFVSGGVSIPTTTVTTVTLTVLFQWYSTSSFGNNVWVCVGSY